MKEYKIITAQTISDMMNNVNEFIRDGWLPLGGLARDGILFLQVIIK